MTIHLTAKIPLKYLRVSANTYVTLLPISVEELSLLSEFGISTAGQQQ